MDKFEQTLRRLRMGAGVIALLACGTLGASWLVEIGAPRQVLATAAVAFATIFVGLHILTQMAVWQATRRRGAIVEYLVHDGSPSWYSDEEGTIFAQNPAAVETCGERAGQTVNQAFDGLLASPDAVVSRLSVAARDGAVGREDVVTRRGNVRICAHRVPGGLLWRIEDLGERPARASDGAGLPMLTFGPSGTILYMNDAIRAAAGQRSKRLRDLFEIVPLENGGLNGMICAEGSRQVRVILSASSNGRQDAFVMPAGDPKDGNVLLDDLPVALLRIDPEGCVISANRLARELLPGLELETEKRLAAMVEGLGRSIREWVGEAASGRGLYKTEVVRVTGAEVETYLQVTLGRPNDGDDSGLIAVLNDATELKTLEAQFVQSQKMQAIGQLAGGVAHDFNNLLTAISGHCDLLLLRHDENDEDFADLTQINHNANRAAALVGQLLAFSRKQTLEMLPIDLRDALGDLTHLLNRLVGDRVTLRLEHDPALIPIRGDRRQLEQVLMNLVVNARDAMPAGGEVLIRTECRYLEETMKRDRVKVPSGQYVVVEVSDSGCGISADNLTRIFEPFFTTKRPGEGTGLGLSMAYGIVKQSGGYIFADSAPGKGTRFSLFFPAMTPNNPEMAAGLTGTDIELDVAQSEPEDSPTQGLAAAVTDPASGAGLSEEKSKQIANGSGALSRQSQDVNGSSSSEAGSASPPDGNTNTALHEPNEGPENPEESDQMDRIMAAVATVRKAEADSFSASPMGTSNYGTSGEDENPEDTKRDLDATSLNTKAAEVLLPSPPISEATQTTGPGAGGKRVVLLVEDEAPVRAFASRALRLRGYEVMEAESAESALDQLADESLWIDLFVTDVMMPGLDGPSWVREALKKRPDVRTIFISGYTQDALSETSAPIPNAVFLPKPFSLSDLTRTVEKALS